MIIHDRVCDTEMGHSRYIQAGRAIRKDQSVRSGFVNERRQCIEERPKDGNEKKSVHNGVLWGRCRQQNCNQCNACEL